MLRLTWRRARLRDIAIVEDSPRPLRADAARNRARIVEAARSAFAEKGVEVGVDEIARRAGVGMGTLYRRFPTKEALVLAILEERVDVLTAVAAELATADPLTALRSYVLRACEEIGRDRGLLQALARQLQAHPELGAGKEVLGRRWLAVLEPLVTRARERGAVREDLQAEDVAVLIRMLAAAAAPGSTDTEPGRGQAFFLDALLDGLRPPAQPAA